MLTYLSAVILSAITLVLHVYGLHGWYVQLVWYDIMMHILGGVTIAVFAYAVLASLRGRVFVVSRGGAWTVVGFVLLAGLIWEGFEIYFDISGHPFGTKLYYIDTVKDLFDDVFGGGIVVAIRSLMASSIRIK